MIRHSERDKRDLRALEVEMARLQGQLNAVKEERDAKVQEGMELVRGPSLITSRSEREGVGIWKTPEHKEIAIIILRLQIYSRVNLLT